MVHFARPGDVVVTWKLDRLGQLRDLVDLVSVLGERGIELRSLREAIDTTTPTGKPTFHIFAALAEFEAEVLSERTRAGLAAARKRGSNPGRPRALTPNQVEMARTMMSNPALLASQVAQQLGVHRSMLYRSINSTKWRRSARCGAEMRAGNTFQEKASTAAEGTRKTDG